jgi:hypothetical protein
LTEVDDAPDATSRRCVMKVTRDTVRIVAPPLLALALVAVVTHPVDAIPTSVPQTGPVAAVGR